MVAVLRSSHGPKFTLGLELTPPGILVAGGTLWELDRRKHSLALALCCPFYCTGVCVWGGSVGPAQPLHSHEVSRVQVP